MTGIPLGRLARNVFTNWRDYDAPFHRKLAIGLRNASTRLRGNTCCGHPGEPGC